ncbi:MAG TPA: Ig-like domain-containing protein [Gemmataceae bacterium]|nr:Ig-like domain-containing protein [Gemmataceae bacterium]
MENFDTTPVGGLPNGWSQSGTFFVASARAQSLPNELETNAEASNQGGRAWLTALEPNDVRVSASVFLDSLNPVQLVARGSGLGGAMPSYYGLEIARGLSVQFVKVSGGAANVVGSSVISTSYTSGTWVRLTLDIQGNTLTGQVYRPDKDEYLNSAGGWQAAPTWALHATDTSQPLVGGTYGSLIGIARPARYAGSISLDDFGYGPASTDFNPPTVAISSPVAGATLSGAVKITARVSDDFGVARVEFTVDGALTATSTSGPYTWSFNTRSLWDGTHLLGVRAYDTSGNTTLATETVVTHNGLALPRPAIASHYSHVRIAELAYSGWQQDAMANDLLSNSVDLVVPNPAYLSGIHAVAPATPLLIYTNVSNVYLGLLTDWLRYADAHGLNREDAFFHVSQATEYAGNSGSSRPVRNFWAALKQGTGWTELTTTRGLDPATNVTFGAANETLYLGYAERFHEINFAATTSAGSGWKYSLEYAIATDSNGNPTRWATLSPTTDTTAGFTRSGTLAFDPPDGWTAAAVHGSAHLFYVRFRTMSAGGGPPAGHLWSRDYTGASGGNIGVIRAFDASADLDHDGYLNDAEYARRAAGMDARFTYEARDLMSNYGAMRFATNPHAGDFQAWAADYNARLLQANPLAGGLFVDNSTGSTGMLATTAVVEAAAMSTYSADYGVALKAVYRATAPGWLLPNTSGYASADAAIQNTGAEYFEFGLRPLAQSWSTFLDVAAHVTHVHGLNAAPPFDVLDSYPRNQDGSLPNGYSTGDPTDGRTQLATLAYYYLLADPQSTFLNFFGGFEPSSSWSRHWSSAAAVDVGQPLGSWSVFASGPDPAAPGLTYNVYQRSLTNALVLYKPLSFGHYTTGTTADVSATVHSLGGTYYLLGADGQSTTPVTSVALRNGEGAILLLRPLAPPVAATAIRVATTSNSIVQNSYAGIVNLVGEEGLSSRKAEKRQSAAR